MEYRGGGLLEGGSGVGELGDRLPEILKAMKKCTAEVWGMT
jgi:hypothetical protein